MEGTTSYGAGLCSYLMERGYDVFEVLRPKREKRRVGEGKTDGIDAEHAAVLPDGSPISSASCL